MQPPPPERARFLQMLLGGALLAGLLLGTSGCTDSAGPGRGYSPFGPLDTLTATDASRDSALGLLSRMNRSAFDSAFVRLDEYSFTRRARTEQLDTTGATTAYRTQTIRYRTGSDTGSIVESDSAGSFRDGGALSSITPTQDRQSMPANLAVQSLEEQPAYLAPRTQESYRYALATDTLLDGTPAYVIEAKARSYGSGADRGIRYARLTLDRVSLQLVDLTTTRASRILLFRENSLLRVGLQRAPTDSSQWVPRVTRFRALVDVPFRAPRQFRTTSAYFDYSRP